MKLLIWAKSSNVKSLLVQKRAITCRSKVTMILDVFFYCVDTIHREFAPKDLLTKKRNIFPRTSPKSFLFLYFANLKAFRIPRVDSENLNSPITYMRFAKRTLWMFDRRELIDNWQKSSGALKFTGLNFC